MEILKIGSISPPLVVDLLLRGKATIPGVEIISKRIGSRGMVIGFDADAMYAVRAGTTPSDVLLASLQDLAWLKEEGSLVQAIFPQAARSLAGVILVADLFPTDFVSVLPHFSFPCRCFRWIALGDQPFPCLLFESYPPCVAEKKHGAEGTTEEEKRFFSSW